MDKTKSFSCKIDDAFRFGSDGHITTSFDLKHDTFLINNILHKLSIMIPVTLELVMLNMVVADGLAPYGARPSATIMMT